MLNMEELQEIFKDIDANKQKLLKPLMEETVFIKNTLDELKKYPLIRINPNNINQQKRTEAGRMFKDYQQAYNNNVKILLSALSKEQTMAESPLLKMLKEYE